MMDEGMATDFEDRACADSSPMVPLFRSRARADIAAEKLKVYAQPQRLMIMSLLLRGEKTVGEIEAATGISQPALSQQLAALRRADVVKTRRVAQQIFYDLADAHVGTCVRSMEALLGGAVIDADAAAL